MNGTRKIYCDKHDNLVVIHAFSKGDCIVCGEEFMCHHTPPDSVCWKCVEEFKVCPVCGDLVEDSE